MAENRINGIGVSNGIAIARTFLCVNQFLNNDLIQEFIEEDQVDIELQRFINAKEQALHEINQLIVETKKILDEDKAAIIQVQKEFLNDPEFNAQITNKIRHYCYTSENAVKIVIEDFASQLEENGDKYFQERISDFIDLGSRLISILAGKERNTLANIKEKIILVADDITPSEIIQLDKNNISGLVTRYGGKTSHTAILARSLKIPAIVGIEDKIENIGSDSTLLIDGTSGVIIINPDIASIKEYQQKKAVELTENLRLREFIKKPAITIDGFRLEIGANISSSAEAEIALQDGAEGIGLFRTEFLFLENDDRLPTEEEQYQAYKQAALAMEDRPVIIRTLDIGGDKNIPGLTLRKETNPFLGYRAIRLSLDKQNVFMTQLRAILRASVYGNLKIMFPMISSLEEVRHAKSIFKEVQEQLKKENIPFNEKIEVGIMIEIPSAAMLAEYFAQEVDFFSIGTNDLIQYSLAVDRTNEKVAYLYNCFHPAVLKFIKMAVDAAHKQGIWVGMCGRMASNPLSIPLLIGMGIDELGVELGLINKIKEVTSKLTYSTCKKLVKDLLTLKTTEEIQNELILFQNYYENKQ